MFTKVQWDKEVNSLNDRLYSLYWDKGGMSLKHLNEFRSLLTDMDEVMQAYFQEVKIRLFPLSRQGISKEMSQLQNQFRVFDYNVSLMEKAA